MLELSAIAASAIAAVAVSLAAQEAVAIHIVSPEDGAYVSGLVTLRVEMTPKEAVARVDEVVFSVDGRVVCRLTAPPFVCDWDAGRRVGQHHVRVVARLGDLRVTHAIRTRKLELAEAVDVDAVQVIAVVTDEQGEFVKGVPQAAFRVYEDDTLQSISHFASERIPLELVAAIDISGSMKSAMPQVKAAAKGFLTSVEAGHEVTVIAFNENLFTLSRRGTDPAVRGRAVDRLAAWGSTALYDAIVHGLDLLSRRPGRRAMVVFTDGDDKLSHASMPSVVRRVETSDATLYMIGQGQAAGSETLQALLTRLAQLSGGRSFFEATPGSLERVFGEILTDLSNQYLLTYQPLDTKRDGRWRAIRVEVDGPGYRVRARQGYRLVARP